jgi:hypothetical protein
VKHRGREAKIWAALLVFHCLLSCAIRALAQDDSSAKLSVVEIQPEPAPSAYLEGAALSPDGGQVAAAFRRVGPGRPTEIALSVRIWKVGIQEPIALKQFSAGEKSEPWTESQTRARGSVQYCDNGLGIMVATRGTLYYLNPQSPVVHATATNSGGSAIPERVFCAANSPRAVIAVYAEAYCCVARVYDLTSGTLIREWNLTKGSSFGDVAISPSGNEIAVSHVDTNVLGRSKAAENLEVFDVNTGKVSLRVKTGHLPGRISFAGETRIATDDTLEPQPLLPHPEINSGT